MNNELVLRLITLVHKNGDRLVLADPNTGKGVVVMDLDSYERLNAALDELQAMPEPPPQPVLPAQGYAQVTRSTAHVEDPPPFIEDEEIPVPPAPVRPAPVQTPHFAPQQATVNQQPGFSAKFSQKTGHRRQTSSFDNGPATADLNDLTQEQVLGKINRDIGDWKTAKERRPIDRAKAPAPRRQAQPEPVPVEDEERFYLEPIE